MASINWDAGTDAILVLNTAAREEAKKLVSRMISSYNAQVNYSMRQLTIHRDRMKDIDQEAGSEPFFIDEQTGSRSKHELYEELSRRAALVKAKVRAWNKAGLLWRSRANLFSPITSLPAEILAMIFKHVAFSPGFPHQYNFHYPSEWISVTHVCLHWRKVALECPSLWSRPCFQNIELAKEMLSRARSAPLRIRLVAIGQELIDCSNHRMTSEGGVLGGLENWARVEELGLLYAYKQKLPFIIPGLIEPAPILETFYLSSLDNHGETLPPNLFGANAPRLSRIHLRNWCFPFSSTFVQRFRCLKDLKVVIGPQRGLIGEGKPYSIHEIIDALSMLSLLEDLHLEGTLVTRDIRGNDTNCRTPKLNWERMSHLFIDFPDPAHCETFFSHISHPNTTRVQLCCWHKHGPNFYEDLIARTGGPIQSCSLNFDQGESPHYASIWLSPHARPTTNISATSIVLRRVPIHDNLLQDLCIGQDLSHMTTRVRPERNSVIWKCIAQMPRLKYLCLHPPVSPGFFNCLHAAMPLDDSSMAVVPETSGEQPMPFTSLQHLDLDHWIFASRQQVQKAYFWDLYEWLEKRAAFGLGPQNIILKSCEGISSFEIEQLRDRVERLCVL